jgi:hypothetical protein
VEDASDLQQLEELAVTSSGRERVKRSVLQ